VFVPFALRILIAQSRFFPRLTEYFVARTGLKREQAESTTTTVE
jgi:hypothetical protein